MHAALVLHSLAHGGTERQATWMAAGLVERGHRVTVVELRAGTHFRDELRASGARLVTLGLGHRLALGRAIGALRELRADVVYGLNPEANLLALAAGAAPVWGVRTTDLHELPKDRIARVAMSLQHRLAGRPRLIVANSRAGVDELRGLGYPPERLRLVGNGLDAERFRPDPAARVAWRARFDVREGERLVAMVARMDRQKDHATFVRAAALLGGGRRRFACFGDGPLRPEVEALAAQLGVELLLPGAVEDMASAYAALDVVALASRWGEGFSNAVAEALAAGVPCVATDNGDHALARDVLDVVPRGDPAALAAAIERADDGSRGPAWVREHYGVERMVSSTEAVLAEALGR